MKENRKEDAVKTEVTSAKESRKIAENDVEQVSGGLDILAGAQNLYAGVPGSGDIKPLPN